MRMRPFSSRRGGDASGGVAGVADFINVIHVLLIKAGDLVAGAACGVDQLVELGLQSRGVAILTTLDDQGHGDGHQGGDGVKIETLRLHRSPDEASADDGEEAGRVAKDADGGGEETMQGTGHPPERA